MFAATFISEQKAQSVARSISGFNWCFGTRVVPHIARREMRGWRVLFRGQSGKWVAVPENALGEV